jgi:hypothetical protein
MKQFHIMTKALRKRGYTFPEISHVLSYQDLITSSAYLQYECDIYRRTARIEGCGITNFKRKEHLK